MKQDDWTAKRITGSAEAKALHDLETTRRAPYVVSPIPWRPPTPEEVALFQSKQVHGATEDDCYGWTGKYREGDYGHFRYCGTGIASRAAWMILVGPIPDGQYVLHRCDNPPCTNLRHLFLGSTADNMRDAAAKGRKGKRRPL